LKRLLRIEGTDIDKVLMLLLVLYTCPCISPGRWENWEWSYLNFGI